MSFDRKEYHKRYYEQNKEKLSEYQKRYYEQNKEKYCEYHKRYQEQNKEKIKELKKRHVAELNDAYVAHQLNLPTAEARKYPELLEARRELIKIRRFIKNN
jgi:ABC-type Zn uptake system ZnuABC Zn-binding protein ZnuA